MCTRMGGVKDMAVRAQARHQGRLASGARQRPRLNSEGRSAPAGDREVRLQLRTARLRRRCPQREGVTRSLPEAGRGAGQVGCPSRRLCHPCLRRGRPCPHPCRHRRRPCRRHGRHLQARRRRRGEDEIRQTRLMTRCGRGRACTRWARRGRGHALTCGQVWWDTCKRPTTAPSRCR